MDVRRLFEEWDETLLGVLFRAKQVAQWDRDHQFCGRCGEPTVDMAEERAKRCPTLRLDQLPAAFASGDCGDHTPGRAG